MKNQPYTLNLSKGIIYFLCFIFFIMGLFYFSYSQGWIIFCFHSYKAEIKQTTNNLRTCKKKVKLIFWQNNQWNTENVEILETKNNTKTMHRLINSWLTLLDEENIIKQKITIQSILLSPNNQLYLSFNQSPFDSESSTYEKLIWIESLLKTIRENGIPFQSIHFLVNHQPIKDYHLDFSNPWPISGFLNIIE